MVDWDISFSRSTIHQFHLYLPHMQLCEACLSRPEGGGMGSDPQQGCLLDDGPGSGKHHRVPDVIDISRNKLVLLYHNHTIYFELSIFRGTCSGIGARVPSLGFDVRDVLMKNRRFSVQCASQVADTAVTRRNQSRQPIVIAKMSFFLEDSVARLRPTRSLAPQARAGRRTFWLACRQRRTPCVDCAAAPVAPLTRTRALA